MTAVAKSRKIVFLAVLTFLLALVPPVGGVAEESPALERPPARGVVDLSGLETFMALEAGAPFQLRVEPSPSVQADSGSMVMDKALGLVGLPGMSGASDDESAYEKAWRMRGGPNGTARRGYGERYRRNPDGSYGAQSSSKWDSANIGDRWLEQALSAGSGYFSSWAEGWLGGYGQARVSVRVNDEGDVTGSGDFLYPFYDSEHSTFFTQLGLRTMANDRVIGNFGLGQRFFPAENFAFGYNAFIDQDFSRNHSRGGVGLEAWYDWLRLSANYYTPLSGWKDSKDYDSRLVEERPAEGYDARLTGYLPFYRNLAVAGAFEQWKGEHVGAFGTDDFLQKDPKVWSYGLEWTPVPAFSTSVNQRHSGGQKETQFWLTFNYHFGMDWEDQLSPALVTEMRTVDGSRHDFVNRQNEIILAYRAKGGAAGGNEILQLQEGLNILISNASGAWVNLMTNAFTSAPFVAGPDYFSTVELKVVEAAAGCDNLTCATEQSTGVTWKVIGLNIPSVTYGWWKRADNAGYGLYLGDDNVIPVDPENHPGGTGVEINSTFPQAEIKLTDIVGSRSVTIEVSASGSSYPDVSESFAFGDGPLSVFRKVLNANEGRQWATAAGAKDAGISLDTTGWGDFNAGGTNFPAVDFAEGFRPVNTGFTYGGSSGAWTATFPSGWTATEIAFGYQANYAEGSKLPKVAQLQAVAKMTGKGAAFAAGWPDDNSNYGWYVYWSGEVFFVGDDGRFYARVVDLGGGGDGWTGVVYVFPVAVGVLP